MASSLFVVFVLFAQLGTSAANLSNASPPSVMVQPNVSTASNRAATQAPDNGRSLQDNRVVQAKYDELQSQYGNPAIDPRSSPRSPAPIKDDTRTSDVNRPAAKATDTTGAGINTGASINSGVKGAPSVMVQNPAAAGAVKGDAAKSDAAKAAALKSDGTKSDGIKTDGIKTDGIKTDGAKSVKIEPAKTEPAKSELDVATRAAANASADLLAKALIPPQDAGLSGRPISLQDALSRVLDRSQRLATARAYWKLSLAGAEYHWAVTEWRQLDATPTGRGAIDAPMLSTARAAAQARALEAQANMVATQHELADALGQSPQNLPLTVDQPLVGPYRTHFETLFANRSATGRLRAIDKTLPLRREAIDVRTAAVQAAASAVHFAETAYAKGQEPVQTLLAAQAELSKQRKAFVAAVRDYNLEIAEYALGVADPGTSNAVLVSMLTRTKPSTKTSAVTAGPATFATMNQPTLADPKLDPEARPIRDSQSFAADDSEGWSAASGVRSASATEDVRDGKAGPMILDQR